MGVASLAAVEPRVVRVYQSSAESASAMVAEVLGAVPISRECRRCGDAKHGKPFVVGDDDLSFSVSHSGSVALLAIARDATVGIDVEAVRTRPNLEKLAARVLDPNALAAFGAADESHQLLTFLRAWTEKEAYLKAIGLGIATDLRAVSVPAEWFVSRLDELPAYVGALAVDRPAEVVRTEWR
jgi:4'-phosphopantetheinyl transferase